MIHLLTDEAFVGALPPPRRSGVNGIFKARLNIAGERRACYIKPLPDEIDGFCGPTANQELFSEALGYCLAKSCGFEVPETAGIIQLPRSVIPERALAATDKISAGNAQQEDYFAWFSEDTGNPDLVWHFAGGDLDPELEEYIYRRISTALAERKDLPKLVSFDEWVQNSDRHPGNLLRAGKQLCLIDHGRMFHFPTWKAAELNRLPTFSGNRVADCVEVTVPQWRDHLPVRQARTCAYNEIRERFSNTGEETTREVLTRLMLDEQDIHDIISFLHSRLHPNHVHTATAMGSML